MSDTPTLERPATATAAPRAASVQALRDDLFHAYRILDRDGQSSAIAGHLTARLPGGRTMFAHRWGLGFDEVEHDDILEADFALRTVAGTGRVNPTLHIHTQIYARRPDVNCIVHTHARNAIALGCIGANLEPITQTGLIFFEDITLFAEFDGIVLDRKEGDAIADALGPRRAVLLQNHGALVVGRSVAEATIAATTLEFAADIQLRAMAAGTPTRIPDAEARSSKRFLLSDEVIGGKWRHAVRGLQRQLRQAAGR